MNALRFACCSFLVACFATIAGCGDESPAVAAPVTLRSVQITSAAVAKPAGLTQQYTATANYSDGHTQDVTRSATWASSAAAVATVDPDGLATTRAVGATTITATLAGMPSNSATLTVTAAQVLSIQVTPPMASVAVGQSQQYTATGTYTDASTQDLTSAVTWTSSNTAVATIGGSGLARAAGIGQTTITAAMSGVQSNAVGLAVNAAALVAIQVTPAVASQAAGARQPYVAVGTFSDGSNRDISATVAWSSSDPSMATVDANGLATTVAPGVASVTAVQGDVRSNTATLTVLAATLVSLQVDPVAATMPVGLAQAFRAVATYSDGTTRDVSNSVGWIASDAAVATIDATGLATGASVGSAGIQAASNAVRSNTVPLTVTPAVLVSIQVTPAASTKVAGTTQQYAATGFYSDLTRHDITATVSWHSSATSRATVTTTGLATAVATGTAEITATQGSIASNTAVLTITAATLVSMQVTPTTASIAAGTTLPFTAQGTYSDGSTQDLSRTAAWHASSAAIATIDAQALSTGVAAGTVTIDATVGPVRSPDATLTVTPAVLASIAVTPATASIAAGLTRQYMAIGTYTDGSTQNVSTTVSWSSSAAAVATIDANGLATSTTAGSTSIAAASGAVHSNDAALTVTPAQLTSIAITPTTVTKAIGTTQQYTARGTYTDGTTPDITTSVTWSASNTAIATIDTAGNATAVSSGSATIRATLSGIQSNAASFQVGTVASGSMVHGRYYHSAALLPNGTVLVAGGFDGAGNITAEIYDPATGTFSAAASMNAPRLAGTIVRLADGRVLLPGGYDGNTFSNPVDVYDPTTRTFVARAPMQVARYFHAATLLPSGKILVTGGYSPSGITNAAEIYDPVADSWTTAASMTSSRQRHVSMLLANGKVLVVGGGSPVAEIYDPATNTWSAAARASANRIFITDTHAASLPNGTIFTAGGGSSTSEVYDPTANTWTPMGNMAISRSYNSVNLLPTGKVVVASGAANLQVFDPATGTFSTTVPMLFNRAYGTATLLNNGRLLFTGGISSQASSELF